MLKIITNLGDTEPWQHKSVLTFGISCRVLILRDSFFSKIFLCVSGANMKVKSINIIVKMMLGCLIEFLALYCLRQS
jgi:hypothetical protein